MAQDQKKFTEQQVIQGKHFSDFRVEQTKTSTAVEVLTTRFDDFKEFISTQLERIEKQTTETNGKVMANTRWRWILIGAWGVISFGFPIYYTEKMENVRNEMTEQTREEVYLILQANGIIE